MLSVRFNDKKLVKSLRQFQSHRISYQQIGQAYKKLYDQNYSAPRGAVFEPPRWRKRKRAYKHPILEKTGKLRAGLRIRTTGNSVRIGNVVKYYKFHQKGTKRLPRRRLIGMNDTVRREIRDEVKRQYIINANPEKQLNLFINV